MSHIIVTTGDILAKYEKIKQVSVTVQERDLSKWEEIHSQMDSNEISEFTQEIIDDVSNPKTLGKKSSLGNRYLSRRDHALEIAFSKFRASAEAAAADAVIFVQLLKFEDSTKSKNLELQVSGLLVRFL